MAIAPGPEQAERVLRFLDYPDIEDVRKAFLLALLELPKISNIVISAESHGVMASLGIYRGDDWCFSLAPAKQWIKVWVRRPELNKRPETGDAFRRLFDEVDQTASSELTARLKTEGDMALFLEVVKG